MIFVLIALFIDRSGDDEQFRFFILHQLLFKHQGLNALFFLKFIASISQHALNKLPNNIVFPVLWAGYNCFCPLAGQANPFPFDEKDVKILFK